MTFREVMLMRVAKSVVLCAEDDQQSRILSKRKRVEARVQLRARIVLLAASGMSDKDIGRKLDTDRRRSEEHTSELQSLMRISYAVFCLKKKTTDTNNLTLI